MLAIILLTFYFILGYVIIASYIDVFFRNAGRKATDVIAV